jgi:prepilin-type N-terminal cleavage/methylation domain-containing protein
MKFNRGFTLIEVIAIITIMAIAAAMVIAYIGTSFTKSALPTGLVSRQYALIQQMEVFTSQYRNELSTNNGTLTTAQLATFQTDHITGQQYVDAANTSIRTLSNSTNSYTTLSVLVVTLTEPAQPTQSMQAPQTLLSVFTP